MKRSTAVNLVIVLAVVVLAALPLLLVDGEFGGADAAAAERIEAEHPDYEPWFSPIFEPSAEVASGLFALQAAIGAGVIGYYFGAARTRRRLGATREDRPVGGGEPDRA